MKGVGYILEDRTGEALAEPQRRDAALAGGANDFLTKPFSPKKLLARIEEILGRV